MTKFACEAGKLEGVKIITPFFVEDERGYFLKNFEKDIFKEFDIEISVYEDFTTYSKHGVIRGMHFQTKKPQDKLVNVIKGKIRDVAVDLRKNSPTFGQWEVIELSDENHKAFWIPKGFAHGFEVLSENAIVSYKCVGKYLSEYDTGICYSDPDINIQWNTINPIVSQKDENLMSFKVFIENYGGL